jgi:type II secretion system protein N
MRERWLAIRPWLLRFAGYPLFFLFFFAVFTYVTFPYDRLREAAIAAVEAPKRGPTGLTTPSNMQLVIGSLGPTFLPGLEVRDAAITWLPQHEGQTAVTARIRRATVHIGLFALLGRTVSADVDIEGLGGTIRGHVVYAMAGPRPGLREADLTLTSVNVGQIGPLVAMVGLPLFGAANGTISLRIPEGDMTHASGSVRLTVNDFRIGDGHAQYRIPLGLLTIEQIRAGQLTAQIDIANGTATVRQFASRSDEFRLNGDGRVRLANEMSQSRLDLGVRFQLTDAYRTKSEVAGRIMSALEFAPQIRMARRADGMLGYRCSGTLGGSLTCPPDTRGPGAGAEPGGGGAPAMRRGF